MSIQKSVIGNEVVLPIAIGNEYMYPVSVEIKHQEPIVFDTLSGPFADKTIIFKPQLVVIFEENAFYQSFGEAEDEVRAAKVNGILKRLILLNEEYMTAGMNRKEGAQMTDEQIKLRRLVDSFVQAANMAIEKAKQ